MDACTEGKHVRGLGVRHVLLEVEKVKTLRELLQGEPTVSVCVKCLEVPVTKQM